MTQFTPPHQGLLLEEGLLYEQSAPGRSGVDLPLVQAYPLRTGQPPRAHIGLPEVSEPQVVRHFVRLSQKNYSIDSGLFPLGSCTMKHNPRLNEKLARHPGFAAIHPLQPTSTVQGALELMYRLQEWLGTLVGLPAVTLQPAAGAHGELTGMMVIRKAHEAKGEKRHIVLVPDSAHGTNPSTAATCGYSIVSIPSTTEGMVNMEALREAVKTHGKSVAAFMLTNPNTCGIFEKNIVEISNIIHNLGAYLYGDGANFNALVGRQKPANFGIDVLQFNLHKTFSTPHGGGGPGCGPVAVRADLAPYLPVPRVIKINDTTYDLELDAPHSIGRIKAFNGQFGMMVRAMAYILSHGGDGLRQVAEDAVLNANYLMHSLNDVYHQPFPGPCMHECLLTDKNQHPHHITTLDMAKALCEFGYHPMTVYFPLIVQGAMLIEPTETESKDTLDAFIATLRHIAALAATPEGATQIKQMPLHTPRRRLDEVQAARKPILSAL